MRCKECNVDLDENVKVCPLCKSKAVGDKPLIENIKTAEYPEYKESRPLKYYVQKNDVYFGKWFMLGVVILSLVLLTVSYIFDFFNTALYTVLPIIYAVSSAVYFVSSLRDSKSHAKGAIYLIALAVFGGIIAIAGYITTNGIGRAYFALGSAIVALLSLMMLSTKYPKEIDEELAGRFHR